MYSFVICFLRFATDTFRVVYLNRDSPKKLDAPICITRALPFAVIKYLFAVTYIASNYWFIGFLEKPSRRVIQERYDAVLEISVDRRGVSRRRLAQSRRLLALAVHSNQQSHVLDTLYQ